MRSKAGSLAIIFTLLLLFTPKLDATEVHQEIEEMISKMSNREKLAQLFIIPFSSNPKDSEYERALKGVMEERVGGVIMMKSELTPGVKMINRLQSLSKIPLLVTIDGEWGVAMRLDSVIAFPRQMQLGALEESWLIEEMGYAVAEQAKRVGVMVNFAPSVDINNNPNNPVIHSRSFGEERERVANYSMAYLKGMERGGVVGSVKHFPGHGDTDSDSHHTLPLLPFSRERLDSLELYPFSVAIEEGVEMVMVGHLELPLIDSTGRASSISSTIVTKLLREQMGYNGIVVTDALNMRGVSNSLRPEEIPLEAYRAGCDLILMPPNLSGALDLMERALKSGQLLEEELNERVRRVLTLKKRLALLSKSEPLSLANLGDDLNRESYKSLIATLSQKSITLIQNRDNNLPITTLEGEKIGYISLGGEKNGEELAKAILNYCPLDSAIIRTNEREERLIKLLERATTNSHTIIALHNTDQRPQENFGIDKRQFELISNFAQKSRATLLYFGSPLALPFLKGLENFHSVVVAYQNSLSNNLAAAELLFGAQPFVGELSVRAGEYKAGHSIKGVKSNRLSYTIPLSLTKKYEQFSSQLDSLIEREREAGLFNSAQLLLLDRERVILHRGYGEATVESQFELGRLEGIATLLPAIINLSDRGRVSLEELVDGKLVADYISSKDDSSLRSIISQRGEEHIEELLKREFYSKMGVWNYSFTDGKLQTTANELAKFIYLSLSKGMFGAQQLLKEESANYMSLLIHYYSNPKRGSAIWIDRERGSALIFLNDGIEGESLLFTKMVELFKEFLILSQQ